MNEPEICYELKEHIAWITLNRPEHRNALTRQNMTVDLPEAWQRFSTDKDARIAIITGSGALAFCAGMDVKQRAEGFTRSADGEESQHRAPVLVSPRANSVTKPVIGAVNGVCTGVGMQIVADCDLLIASETAYFSDARTSVGLIPALGAAELARVMPLHEALRLLFLGRHHRLTAERAYQIGFVGELAPSSELHAATTRLAQLVMQNAPHAIRLAKQAVWESLDRGLTEGITHARSISAANPTTEDVREGSQAFVQRRTPDWKLS